MQAKPMKRVVAIVLLVLLAAAAYWFWSPLLALRQMQTAAKAMDGAAFNERVDYPRLRESVKASLLGQQAAQEQPDDAGARMGRAFGEMLMGRLIDGLVQPEIVMRMMEQGKFQRAGEAGAGSDEADADRKDWFGERGACIPLSRLSGTRGSRRSNGWGW